MWPRSWSEPAGSGRRRRHSSKPSWACFPRRDSDPRLRPMWLPGSSARWRSWKLPSQRLTRTFSRCGHPAARNDAPVFVRSHMTEIDSFLKLAALELVRAEGVRIAKSPPIEGMIPEWAPGWDEWEEVLVGDGPGVRPAVFAFRSQHSGDQTEALS